MTKQQQVGNLLIAVPVFIDAALNHLPYINAPVGEFTFLRVLFSLVDNVAMYVTDLGQAGQYTGAIAVSQASLYIILFIERRVNVVILFKLLE